MASKLIKKDNKHKAKIVTENQQPCAFCHRKVNDEISYGKLYAIGDIQCHYFCALLSCCLVQNGPDEVGLFGFLYLDILAELERCKKHRCSYCGQVGASIGCCVSTCKKQFHLPCGRAKDAVSLFYGTFKSFCRIHAPKQKIPDHIMSKAKIRMKQDKRVSKKPDKGTVEKTVAEKSTEDMVCVICYEEVDGFPTLNTFWPPCCARDAWFHRSCLQRMALTAGMHYLKCPLCNDKNTFHESVVAQGYYVPDRDAAWELEQNAFSEIYERPIFCGAENCLCPLGRKHDAETGPWDIKLCLLCGSVGRHAQCATDMFVCETCKPVAPSNLDELANKIENVIQQEQGQTANNRRRRPLMPCRMSLRRTKGRDALLDRPSSSRANASPDRTTESQNTTTSRLELNIKPPRKPSTRCRTSNPENDSYISPSKVINGLQQKGLKLDEKVVDKIKRKMLKPRPLSVKRRIVNEILKNKSPLKEHKQKEPVKEWCSPKKHDIDNTEDTQPTSQASTPHKVSKTPTPVKNSKTPQKSPKNSEKGPILDNDESSNSSFELPPEFIADVESDESCQFDNTKSKTIDIKHNSSLEIFEKDEAIGIDVVKFENTTLLDKIFKLSPLHESKAKNMDIENFKKEYLNEVDKKYKMKSENGEACTKLPTPEKENNKLSMSNNCQSDVQNGGRKRRCRSETVETIHKKKRNVSENDLILRFDLSPEKGNNKNEQKINKKKKLHKKKNKRIRSKKNLKLTFDSVETKRKNKKSKLKTKFSINNKNIKLKIKWKTEQLSLKLESKTKQEKKVITKDPSNLKQYILHYPTGGSSKEVLVKPESDIKTIKTKKIKLEKSPDKLKQTSLHSFFTIKSPNDK